MPGPNNSKKKKQQKKKAAKAKRAAQAAHDDSAPPTGEQTPECTKQQTPENATQSTPKSCTRPRSESSPQLRSAQTNRPPSHEPTHLSHEPTHYPQQHTYHSQQPTSYPPQHERMPLPQQPFIYDPGNGPRVRDARAFVDSPFFAHAPAFEDPLCAEFAQGEVLEMLRMVLPEEMALVSGVSGLGRRVGDWWRGDGQERLCDVQVAYFLPCRYSGTTKAASRAAYAPHVGGCTISDRRCRTSSRTGRTRRRVARARMMRSRSPIRTHHQIPCSSASR